MVNVLNRTTAAIESSNTDELLRIVDGHCAAESWDELVELRWLCRAALERGKQLWGVEEHVRYRLALEAPPQWAGPATTEGPTRFTLGPLPEVVASTHLWDDLAPFLDPGPIRSMVAHECVLRSQVLSAVVLEPPVLELPLELCGWEPRYPVADYKSDRAEFPSPDLPPFPGLGEAEVAEQITDVAAEAGLAALVGAWVEESNGRCQTVAVEGTAVQAVATLGTPRFQMAELAADQALAWMAWAGASGGAHGRRRGAASGRFAAWWAVSMLAGLEWPPEPGEVAESLEAMDWWVWNDLSPATGWVLNLAIEDPETGLAWAIAARDAD